MTREVSYVLTVDLDTNEVLIDWEATRIRFGETSEEVWTGTEWREFQGDEADKADYIIRQLLSHS